MVTVTQHFTLNIIERDYIRKLIKQQQQRLNTDFKIDALEYDLGISILKKL